MKVFNQKNYAWSLDGLLMCIEENSLQSEVILFGKGTAIVYVKSYYDSQVLGANSDWCICQHDVSWKQYVSGNANNVQLFFYNFNLKPTDSLALVGATFRMKNKWTQLELTCCFVRENVPIGKKKFGEDLLALNDLVMIPNFGFKITPKCVLVDSIKDAKEEKEKPKEKFDLTEQEIPNITSPYPSYSYPLFEEDDWEDWDTPSYYSLPW